MVCRWFGYILWAIAYFQMTKGRRTAGAIATAETVLNVLILITGLFFFTAGTYASVQSIIDSCESRAVQAGGVGGTDRFFRSFADNKGAVKTPCEYTS